MLRLSVILCVDSNVFQCQASRALGEGMKQGRLGKPCPPTPAQASGSKPVHWEARGRGDFLIPSWVPWESPRCSPMGTTGKRRNWDLEGGKKTVEVTVEQMLSRAALKSLKGTRASLKLLEGHHGAGRAVGESPWAEKVPLGWGVPEEAPGVTALGATAEGQA